MSKGVRRRRKKPTIRPACCSALCPRRLPWELHVGPQKCNSPARPKKYVPAITFEVARGFGEKHMIPLERLSLTN